MTLQIIALTSVCIIGKMKKNFRDILKIAFSI